MGFRNAALALRGAAGLEAVEVFFEAGAFFAVAFFAVAMRTLLSGIKKCKSGRAQADLVCEDSLRWQHIALIPPEQLKSSHYR
ncbi:MAG: hypothetical protein M0Q54_01910 [Pigmentiphaga sp.]|nr:hypothetical protein [Pigmentiphaga sp.]